MVDAQIADDLFVLVNVTLLSLQTSDRAFLGISDYC